jgi:hypothetical protein
MESFNILDQHNSLEDQKNIIAGVNPKTHFIKKKTRNSLDQLLSKP